MRAQVAATPTSGTSSAEALVLLLLAVCGRQRREIDRLTEERAVLVEASRELVAERDELRQRNEELSRRLGLDSTNSCKPPSSDGLKRKRRTVRSTERERRNRLGRGPGTFHEERGRGRSPDDPHPTIILGCLPMPSRPWSPW